MNDQTNNLATVGKLNSDFGKELSKWLDKSALIQIADWCETAQAELERIDDISEQLDAGIFQDAACTLRKLAEHAT